jgi:SAM-dependent methyltransferase
MKRARDIKMHSPAFLRNREPILTVLSRILPPAGLALEIASGSGEHAGFFAHAFPKVIWQPTDRTPAALASIEAYRLNCGLDNLRPPILLDVTAQSWPMENADIVLCINMIHISPWEAAKGLMEGAGRVLSQGSILFLYGPFKEGGAHTADSNWLFDEDLRARNPAWGVRDLEEVIEIAACNKLFHRETIVMPANNRSVIFERFTD